jgi:hypothetical protein
MLTRTPRSGCRSEARGPPGASGRRGPGPRAPRLGPLRTRSSTVCRCVARMTSCSMRRASRSRPRSRSSSFRSRRRVEPDEGGRASGDGRRRPGGRASPPAPGASSGSPAPASPRSSTCGTTSTATTSPSWPSPDSNASAADFANHFVCNHLRQLAFPGRGCEFGFLSYFVRLLRTPR